MDIEKINRQELNKYWWHRLYKVLLWLISMTILIGVLCLYIKDGTLIFVIVGSIMFSSFAFISTFLFYRIILYVVSGKLLLGKIDKKEIYIATLIGVISSVSLWLLNVYY